MASYHFPSYCPRLLRAELLGNFFTTLNPPHCENVPIEGSFIRPWQKSDAAVSKTAREISNSERYGAGVPIYISLCEEISRLAVLRTPCSKGRAGATPVRATIYAKIFGVGE